MTQLSFGTRLTPTLELPTAPVAAREPAGLESSLIFAHR